MPSRSVQDYHIGWVCALHIELAAAIAMLDEEHEMMTDQDTQDHNSYVLGRIHKHNVVIACLPDGVYGLVSAANVAKDMARTFPGLRFGLMVGIGGGIPNLSKGIDIRLADVVVSKPEKGWGGVVQYDKGKAEEGCKFVRKGQLNQPPALLLNTLSQLRARHSMRSSRVMDYITEASGRNSMMEEHGFTRPSVADHLFCSVCDTDIEGPAVPDCSGFHTIRRSRKLNHPAVHYGVIASSNVVVKRATLRDRIRDKFDALCVETEAAGLMNEFPCLVIRGICDYADKHKNDDWQRYAAMTAAAYAKEFLQYISPAQTQPEKRIRDIMESLETHAAQQSRLAEEHLDEVQREHGEQHQRYLNDRYRQCHRTFKTSTYEEFKNVNPDRLEGTCQWVLTHPQYLQWHEKQHDYLLWISADPGCGKSVLARSLVDHELQNTDQHTVCHFFFKDNNEQDRLTTALCALLHQLFSHQPGLIPHAIPAWEKAGDKVAEESTELWRIFLKAATASDAHDVTCVIDALDECRPSDQQRLIELLSRFHRHTQGSRRSRLKFIVTSRPYDDIRSEFQKMIHDLPTIRLKGEEENEQIHQEIDLVIQMRIGQLARDLQLDSSLASKLETRLLEMEHRTYLWLYLAIDSIKKSYRMTLRSEEASIQSLPSSVEDAYQKILSRVDQEQSKIVRKIFQIVLGARRPLSVDEMAIALGIATRTRPKSLDEARLSPEHLQSKIRDWCGLFVFIKQGRIHLIHQTAKEFLLSDSGSTPSLSSWKHCLDPQGIEKEMARICVEFLGFDDVRSIAESLAGNIGDSICIKDSLSSGSAIKSFLAYSAKYWSPHLQHAQIPAEDELRKLISAFYDNDAKLCRLWLRITNGGLLEDLPTMNSIQLAAIVGDEEWLASILKHDQIPDINRQDYWGNTPLSWASELGHEKVARTLKERGADINALGRGGKNALHAAIQGGRESMVKMLLEKGANVKAKVGEHDAALYIASERGNEKMVQLLLQNGADVNARGWNGTALYIASERGNEKMVQLLLQNGADVNARGWNGTALYTASECGNEKMAQLLLQNGADVNTRGWNGTALYVASERGHEKIVQLLLQNGADVNARGLGGTALYIASERGHEKMVQLLLQNGADVNTRGWDDTALYIASECGNEKLVQLLLQNGADVNAGSKYHDWNALCAASDCRHKKVVQILLNHGAVRCPDCVDQ